ncbi:MAG: SIS domain-containing protein [Bacteroidota bacterium]
MRTEIQSELQSSARILEEFYKDDNNLYAIEIASQQMVACLHNGGKIIACGNGGSLCDAMHFAEELAGKFRDLRRPLPAIAITDPSYLSCVSNDVGFESVYSRFVEAFAKQGDLVLGISTSGNSQNVVNALQSAKKMGAKTVALTGNGGGALAEICDHEVRVNHFGYADKIQEVHIKVIHIFISLIEKFTIDHAS